MLTEVRPSGSAVLHRSPLRCNRALTAMREVSRLKLSVLMFPAADGNTRRGDPIRTRRVRQASGVCHTGCVSGGELFLA